MCSHSKDHRNADTWVDCLAVLGQVEEAVCLEESDLVEAFQVRDGSDREKVDISPMVVVVSLEEGDEDQGCDTLRTDRHRLLASLCLEVQKSDGIVHLEGNDQVVDDHRVSSVPAGEGRYEEYRVGSLHEGVHDHAYPFEGGSCRNAFYHTVVSEKTGAVDQACE